MNEVHMFFVVLVLSVLIVVFISLVLGDCDHNEHVETTEGYVTSNRR
jgi:hypothetical protein